MNRKDSFRKPTAVAVGAALVGVSLHLAVFFLFRIDFERPVAVAQEKPRLAFAGEVSAENSSLVDPLVLLLSGQRTALPSGVRDFREISISKEISAHPPSLLLRRKQGWTDWVSQDTNAVNPGTWILGRTVNPLRNYARDGFGGPPLNTQNLTVRIENLSNGSVRSVQLPLSDTLHAALSEASVPNPPVFLLDRSDRFSNPPPLPVASSGNVSFDRAVKRALAEGLLDPETDRDYYRLTFFFPPPQQQETN